MERINAINLNQFPALREKFINNISDQMVNPAKTKSCPFLMVADDFYGSIRGLAFFMHMADLKICFLVLLKGFYNEYCNEIISAT